MQAVIFSVESAGIGTEDISTPEDLAEYVNAYLQESEQEFTFAVKM